MDMKMMCLSLIALTHSPLTPIVKCDTTKFHWGHMVSIWMSPMYPQKSKNLIPYSFLGPTKHIVSAWEYVPVTCDDAPTYLFLKRRSRKLCLSISSFITGSTFFPLVFLFFYFLCDLISIRGSDRPVSDELHLGGQRNRRAHHLHRRSSPAWIVTEYRSW